MQAVNVETAWKEVKSLWKDVEPIWHRTRAVYQAVHVGDAVDDKFQDIWRQIQPVWEEVDVIRRLVNKIRDQAQQAIREAMQSRDV